MAQPAAGRRSTPRSLRQSHLARIVNNSSLKLHEYQLLNAYGPMDECSYPPAQPRQK